MNAGNISPDIGGAFCKAVTVGRGRAGREGRPVRTDLEMLTEAFRVIELAYPNRGWRLFHCYEAHLCDETFLEFQFRAEGDKL